MKRDVLFRLVDWPDLDLITLPQNRLLNSYHGNSHRKHKHATYCCRSHGPTIDIAVKAERHQWKITGQVVKREGSQKL